MNENTSTTIIAVACIVAGAVLNEHGLIVAALVFYFVWRF